MSDKPTHIVIIRRWIRGKPKLSYHGTTDAKQTLCGRQIGTNVMIPIIADKFGITCFECKYVLKHGVRYGMENE